MNLMPSVRILRHAAVNILIHNRAALQRHFSWKCLLLKEDQDEQKKRKKKEKDYLASDEERDE